MSSSHKAYIKEEFILKDFPKAPERIQYLIRVSRTRESRSEGHSDQKKEYKSRMSETAWHLQSSISLNKIMWKGGDWYRMTVLHCKGPPTLCYYNCILSSKSQVLRSPQD